jgi:hypothetical protein
MTSTAAAAGLPRSWCGRASSQPAGEMAAGCEDTGRSWRDPWTSTRSGSHLAGSRADDVKGNSTLPADEPVAPNEEMMHMTGNDVAGTTATNRGRRSWPVRALLGLGAWLAVAGSLLAAARRRRGRPANARRKHPLRVEAADRRL